VAALTRLVESGGPNDRPHEQRPTRRLEGASSIARLELHGHGATISMGTGDDGTCTLTLDGASIASSCPLTAPNIASSRRISDSMSVRRVTSVMVIAGAVDSFDVAAFTTSMATFLDVHEDALEVRVRAASVEVTTIVTLDGADQAEQTSQLLSTSTTELSASLGVTVESAEPATTTSPSCCSCSCSGDPAPPAEEEEGEAQCSPGTLIGVGEDHTCMSLPAFAPNTIRCWGGNGNGQVGDGTTDDKDLPVAIDVGGAAVQLALGSSHSCVLRDTATARLLCWGLNNKGQLGDGSTQTRSSPVEIFVPGTIAQVFAGDFNTCVVIASGLLNCWGRNDFGQVVGCPSSCVPSSRWRP